MNVNNKNMHMLLEEAQPNN